MTPDPKRHWRVALGSLGNNLSEARELAAVLEETLGLRVDYGTLIPRSAATAQPRGHSFKDRLRSGTPIPIDDRSINWSQLRYVISTESLKAGEVLAGARPGNVQLEVNSGGRVFFCFFAPSQPGGHEGVAVLKFGPNRLLMQAEQFANELTRHLDICAPDCRIVRQAGPSSDEWRALTEACVRLGSCCDATQEVAGIGDKGAAASGGNGVDSSGGGSVPAAGMASGAAELAAELASLPVVLLMEYCPGNTLLECEEAFMNPEPRLGTFEELGRLFLLDAVLGNADRLPCADLCWRGNPNNILYGSPGSRYESHIVAIDSCVQRRPPAARLSAEDEGVDRLAQLLLTDQDVALELLRNNILAHSPPALAAISAAPAFAAEAFQQGFRECLGRVERIKGLLEMMHSKMHDWSMEFIMDMKALRPELPIPSPAAVAAPGGATGLGSVTGAVGAGRLVAHYGTLGIRVGPGSGGGASTGTAGSGARGRAGQATWTSGGAGGASGGVGSPMRARLSPYLASSSARRTSRSRNSSVGGANNSFIALAATGASGAKSPPPLPLSGSRPDLQDDSGTADPTMQAQGPQSSAGGACVFAFAAAASRDSLHQQGSDGGLGEGSVGGAPPAETDSPICHTGADPHGAPDGRAAEDNAAAGPSDGRGSRRSPTVGQADGRGVGRAGAVLKRRGCGALAAAMASGTLPDRLARSPYLTSGLGGGSTRVADGGVPASLSVRWKSVTSSGALARSSSSRTQMPSQPGSNASRSTVGNRDSGGVGSGVRLAQSPRLLTLQPASGDTSSSPTGHASGSGSATTEATRASEQGSSPRLPKLARTSSPSSSSWTSGATTFSDGRKQPRARRLSDLGSTGCADAAATGRGSSGVFPETAACGERQVATRASPQARDSGPGAAAAARTGRMSVGNSPTRPPLSLRIKSTVYGPWVAESVAVASAGGGNIPTLRQARSFGHLRSPRNALRPTASPRKSYLSPATPKFRSPVLEPLARAEGDAAASAGAAYAALLGSGERSAADHAAAASAAAGQQLNDRHQDASGVTPAALSRDADADRFRAGGALNQLHGVPCAGMYRTSSKPPLPRGSSLSLLSGTSLTTSGPGGSKVQALGLLGSGTGHGHGTSVGLLQRSGQPVESVSHPGPATAAATATISSPQDTWRQPTGCDSATASTALPEPVTPSSTFRCASSTASLRTPASVALLPGAPTPVTLASPPHSAPEPGKPSVDTATTWTPGTPTAGASTSALPAATPGAAAAISNISTPSTGIAAKSTGGITARRGAGRVAGGADARSTGGGSRVGVSRGTPGSGGAAGRVVLRASPSHASPYDHVRSDMSLTQALKSITVEARKDDLLSNRVAHWKELFRARGEELKSAVGEWQSRHRLERVLTTGFLDGTHPIVDTYELKVRLEHMLRRLQVLQEAAAAQKPSCVLEPPAGLFLGGAVCADSHHILRHLGVTHIVNATEELLLPPPSTGFVVLRAALRDVDEEDISSHFEQVSEFIQSCHATGGSVLVHCSEGKSRSVTLVLAYLMRVRRWQLKEAFDLVRSRRSVACPNAGFMNRLLSYERELYGDNSYIPQQLKKAKPEPIVCSVCGAAVGISSASLAVHMKRAHPAPSSTAATGPPTAVAAVPGAVPPPQSRSALPPSGAGSAALVQPATSCAVASSGSPAAEGAAADGPAGGAPPSEESPTSDGGCGAVTDEAS